MLAFDIAEDLELDLIEVSPDASPPVVKLMNFSKYVYDQKKKLKGSKKTITKVKEVKFKPNIESHDRNMKINNARKFIDKGHKVKLTLQLKGREMYRMNEYKSIISEVVESLSDISRIDSPLKASGRQCQAIISPMSKK